MKRKPKDEPRFIVKRAESDGSTVEADRFHTRKAARHLCKRLSRVTGNALLIIRPDGTEEKFDAESD